MKIRALCLPRTPSVVVALQDMPSIEKIAAAHRAGVWDIVELRIDLQGSDDPAHRFAEALKRQGIPTIATLRSKAEGGAWCRSEAERLACFRTLIPHVSAVDIELSSQDIRDEVIAAAHADGKAAIVSCHFFQAFPTPTQLDQIAEQATLLDADILKVAAWAEYPEDIRTLARFTLAHADRNLVTLAMGPRGALSRIFFPALGSLWTYTFWGTETAPGQMDITETHDWLTRFYPDFSRLRGPDVPLSQQGGSGLP